MKTPWKAWCLTGGNLFITKAEGTLVEDAHVDGGAGMVVMGITLFGKRVLNCWNTDKIRLGAPTGSQPEQTKLQLPQEPGTVWLSCAAAFCHQAEHQPSDDLTTFGEIDKLSAAVIIRSTLFPHDRARLTKNTPNPKVVFQTIAKAIETWQGQNKLTLPSLEQVIAAQQANHTLSEQPSEHVCSERNRKWQSAHGKHEQHMKPKRARK